MKSKILFSLRKPNFLCRFFKTIAAERELWVIGILALMLYIPAFWWGLPYATGPQSVHGWDLDAVTGLQTLSEMHNFFVQTKPDWYLAYPPFHYFVLSIFYTPYLAFLLVTNGISQPTGEYPYGLRDPVSAIKYLSLIGRSVTILMAGGVVINAYLTARTVWDKRTARLTAIAVALPTPMVYYARTGNLDVPVLFWMSLTILLLARALVFGLTVRRAVWLGVCAALAVATKDQAYGALAVGLLMLVIIHLRNETDNIETISRWKPPLILIFTGIIVYAFSSGLLLSPHRFFGHLWFITNYDKTFFNVIRLDILRPKTLSGYAMLMLDLLQDLFIAVGPVLILTGLVGMALIWRSTKFAGVLLGMLGGYIVLAIFPIHHTQYRYILFPAFVLAFFTARLLALGLQQKKWIAASALAVTLIGFGWLGLRAIDLTYQMLFDARYEAGQWFEQNSRSGDKVAFFNSERFVYLQKEIIPLELLDDPSPIKTLQQEQVKFVIVQPDFSSSVGESRSYFLPESTYEQLNDGSLGYEKAASFETRPLFHGFFLDLPLVTPGYIVNPPVKIYELKSSDSGQAVLQRYAREIQVNELNQ